MANYNDRNNNESVEFKLISRIGTLANYQTGWNKEINIVAWNGGVPKYDVRDWNPEHDRMTRGVTLHEEEAKKLVEILTERFARGETLAESSAAVPEESPADEEKTADEPVCDENGVVIDAQSA